MPLDPNFALIFSYVIELQFIQGDYFLGEEIHFKYICVSILEF